jgi:lipopolysaccharide transport system permease protein
LQVRLLGQYADLLLTLTAHRLRVRYKQSALGAAWAILQPVSMMLIFTGIFTLIARVSTGDVPYALFAYCALVPWTFFATGLSNATNALVSHVQLVTKVYFPREILPLTYVAAALVDFALAAIVLAPLLAFYDVPATWSVLRVVPIVGILTALLTSLALIASAAQVRVRDLGVAMPLVLQLWMFASPVLYPLAAVPARLRPWYELNPLVGLVENFRRAVLGQPADVPSFVTAAIVSFAALPISYVAFKRAEATMADVI